MIFIAGFILFNCGRIILSILDYKIITESDKYIFYTFSNETINNVLSLLGCSISACILGYLSNRNRKKPQNISKEKTKRLNSTSTLFKKILKRIILISVPGLIYKSLYELSLIHTYGYNILYIETPPAPLFARISWGIFSTLFPMLFLFPLSKNEFKKTVIFFFIVSFCSFLKGTRGTLLMPILFFTWYYYTFYTQKDISLKKILIALIGVSILAYSMLLLREDGNNDFSGIKIMQLINDLFQSQGVTYVVLGNYLDYSNTFIHQTNWYILHPIINTFFWFFVPAFRETGQSFEVAKQTFSLDDQIMYSIAPELYLNGVGYGSSYIAELHALGGCLTVILGSFLLGYFIRYFENRCYSSKYLLYFSWFFIPHLAWMSRSSFIPNIFMFGIGILFYWTVIGFIKNSAKRYKPKKLSQRNISQNKIILT